MKQSLTIILIIGLLFPACKEKQVDSTPPNFIIFFTDDLGYNDLSCYGAEKIKTPNIDQMADEGIKFTSFYAQSLCGPSRAALLTGSYPIRVAEPENSKGLHPKLHPKEITIAEVLKTEGYRTGCFGKWHAGENDGQMPLDQGFDYFFGTPKYNGHTKLIEQSSFRCQILRNRDTVSTINTVEEMAQLTKLNTQEAISFIKENKEDPFFVYLAQNMPHVPLGASKDFRGRSAGGFYGDVIEELDWSMGEIMKTLKEEGLDENTFVIFTSDNGPWIEKKIGNHGGSAYPLRGAKSQTWEGGLKVPCIMRWPGKIESGLVNDELLTTMDFFPTFSELADVKLPSDLTLDGKSFTEVIFENKESSHDYFYYYTYSHLQAVRDREWKLVLPRPAKPKYLLWWARKIDKVEEVTLYHIKTDREERFNVAQQHPEIVEELMKAVEKARVELGDNDRIGEGARFFDHNPKDQRIKNYQKWLDTQK